MGTPWQLACWSALRVFYLRVKRVWGSACSVLRSRDLQHGLGAAGDPGNNGWTLFEQGRLHTRPHCRSLRLGNTTEAFIAAPQLKCERMGMKCWFTLWLFFFSCLARWKTLWSFCATSPIWSVLSKGPQHAAGWFIVECNTVALTCIILSGQCCWMSFWQQL